MKFLFTKAGNVDGAKFSKRIGQKTFSYVGDKEEGVMFEEFVFKGVTKCIPEIENKVFVVFTEIKDELMAVSFFNDKTSVFEGEDTVYYDLRSVKEEDAKNYLTEFLSGVLQSDMGKSYAESIKEIGAIGMEVDPSKEKVVISSKKGECSFNLDEVVPEEMIGGFKRVKKAVAKVLPSILTIAAIGAMNYAFYKYYLHGKRLKEKRNEIRVLQVTLDKKSKSLEKLQREMELKLLNMKKVKKAQDFRERDPKEVVARLEGLRGVTSRHVILKEALEQIKARQAGKKNGKRNRERKSVLYSSKQ